MRRRAGLTLAELVLALASLSLIGAAAATLLFTCYSGTTVQADSREMMIGSEVMSARMADAVRRSKMVLDKGSNFLVLWTADVNKDGGVQLSELVRIERDTSANTLTLYKAPAGVSPDTAYSLSGTDFAQTTSGLKGTANFPAQLLGTSVTGWSLVLDNAVTRSATYVSWQLTVSSGNNHQTGVGGAALRNT